MVLLKKPAPKMVLDAASVSMFVEMLASPYALEPEHAKMMQHVQPIGYTVGATETGKVQVVFDRPIDCLTLAPEKAKALGEEMQRLVGTAANPT